MSPIYTVVSMNDLVCRLLKVRYADCSFCYFYGSAATGSYRANSDIDLIVVDADTPISYREKFQFEGFLIDVFVYDQEALNGTIHMARTNGQFVTVDAIIAATTLPAATVESAIIKEVAMRIRSAGYLHQGTLLQRQTITGLLDDLADSTVTSERIMLCIDIFKSTVDLFLICNDAGVCTRKHAAREFAKINAALQIQLDEALYRALRGDSSYLVAIATKVLDRIGGELRESFSMHCPAVPRMPLPRARAVDRCHEQTV